MQIMQPTRLHSMGSMENVEGQRVTQVGQQVMPTVMDTCGSMEGMVASRTTQLHSFDSMENIGQAVEPITLHSLESMENLSKLSSSGSGSSQPTQLQPTVLHSMVSMEELPQGGFSSHGKSADTVMLHSIGSTEDVAARSLQPQSTVLHSIGSMENLGESIRPQDVQLQSMESMEDVRSVKFICNILEIELYTLEHLYWIYIQLFILGLVSIHIKQG